MGSAVGCSLGTLPSSSSCMNFIYVYMSYIPPLINSVTYNIIIIFCHIIIRYTHHIRFTFSWPGLRTRKVVKGTFYLLLYILNIHPSIIIIIERECEVEWFEMKRRCRYLLINSSLSWKENRKIYYIIYIEAKKKGRRRPNKPNNKTTTNDKW